MSDLRPLYREMADRGHNFHGLSVLGHTAQIGRLIDQYRAQSILDYGSGRGDAYLPPYEIHHAWGVPKPRLYDPGFAELDVPPAEGELFDGVICSDVLEHVPQEDVPAFIGNLFAHARSFVWASVCCRAAKKTFPDGTNLHVTIHRFRWWNKQFAAKERFGVAWLLTQTP